MTTQDTEHKEPPQDIQREMARLKAYFPFRHVFCIYNGETWEAQARTTKHTINTALRKGYKVWTV